MANSDGQGGSAYPKSVQAGIPRLQVPDGWTAPRIGKLFKVVKRPVDLVDDEEYQLVTARRNRGGIVAREQLRGKDILTKSQFRVAEGDFLISRRQIAHGACGIVPVELDGAIVSNEYAVLRPTGLLDTGYMRHLPHSVYFQQTCFHSSIGVHVEKLVFKLEDWWNWRMPIPQIPEQQKIAAALDAWTDAITEATNSALRMERRYQGLAQTLYLVGGKVHAAGTDGWAPLSKFAEVTRCQAQIGSKDAGATGHPLFTAGGLAGNYEPASNEGEAIILSAIGARCGKCFYTDGSWTAGANTLVIKPKNANNARYLYHYLESFQPWPIQGSGQPYIGPNQASEASVPECDPHRQSRVATILDDAATQMQRGQALVNALKRQRKALFQKLLPGDLRIPSDALPPASTERFGLESEIK